MKVVLIVLASVWFFCVFGPFFLSLLAYRLSDKAGLVWHPDDE